MNRYVKPIIVDETIEIDDIVMNSIEEFEAGEE